MLAGKRCRLPRRDARAVAGARAQHRNQELERERARFVPGTRAYSVHNRLHVNTPTPCRFAQSYIIGNPCGLRTTDQQPH